MRRSVAMALAVAATLTPATLHAATRGVTTGGADSGDCTGSPCATLTYAIGQAAAGDIVSVGAGSFNNGGAPIVVNKSVTLRGAQAGVDARVPRGAESVLTQPVQLAADGVRFDGFTVTCGSCDPAVTTSQSFSGHVVINDIITGNTTGVSFGSSGAVTSTLSFSKIAGNNAGPSSLHYGIATFSAVTNAVVSQNIVSGHETAQIDFARTPPQSPATVTISGNTIPLAAGEGPAVLLVGNTGSVVSGNTVTGGDSPFGSIFIAGGDTNIAVTGNTVTGAKSAAVMVWGFFFALGVPFNGAVSITGNTLLGNGVGVGTGPNNAVPIDVHVNRIAGNGVAVSATTFVQGENNWWGCNTFPFPCASFAGSVDFDPWLLMGIAAIPPAINMAQTSSAVVSLEQNSDGAFVPGFPDGASVAFSAAGGTMAPPSAPTIGGLDESTFTPSAPGTATVSATLDSQTVSAPVVVAGDIPALSPTLLALLGAVLAAIALAASRSPM